MGYQSLKPWAEEHPLELERIRHGKVWHPPAPETRYRRIKLYAPLATLFVLVSVLGTWRWLTAETTAITTVPRAAVEQQAYQPVLPTPRAVRLEATPLPTPLNVLTVAGLDGQQQEAQPPLIPHPVDGERAQCLVCHDTYSMIKPAPRSHTGFTEDTCQTCHSLQGETP